MTREEFARWFLHHQSAFPSIAQWLERVTSQRGGFSPTPASVVDRWADVLADVPYEAAIEATNAIARGDEEEPRGYDRHPAAVRAIARRMAARRGRDRPGPTVVDGQETYACLQCRDTGLVTIFHPKTIQAAYRGELTPDRVYTAASACPCEAGRRHAGWLIVYDPRRHLEVPVPEPVQEEAIAVIQSWLAELTAGKPWEP